jgi:membrane-associated protease RseP (regulator of RpoE activity)
MMARRWVGLVSTLLLFAGQTEARPVQTGVAATLSAIRAADRRVATIGHRLAVSNLAWCAHTEWRHGLVLLELSDISGTLRGEAFQAFRRDRGLGIMALAANGPAERAGLRPNDIITGFDGHPLPPLGGAPQAQNQSWFAALTAAFEDGLARVDILRGDARMTLTVQGERGCATVFQGAPRQSRNANADGITVNVNVGLIDYARDDDELAAVMAHEFAHNVLRHRDRLNAARVSRGVLGVGRGVGSIRQTEIEADRLSVYLMERAGYDPEAAVRFWSRYGPHPLNFLRSRDHPGWRERIALMQAEIAKIRAARAAGRTPGPDFVTLPWPD